MDPRNQRQALALEGPPHLPRVFVVRAARTHDFSSGRMVSAIVGMTRRKIKRRVPARPPGRLSYRPRPMASRTAVSTDCSVAVTGVRSIIQRMRSSV